MEGRNASSNLRCAAECVSDTSCAAHVYDATTSTCQGYRSAIQREIVQGTSAEDGYVVYYLQRHVRVATTGALSQTRRTAVGMSDRETTTSAPPVTQARRTAGTVSINQNCNKSTKCHVLNSRCSRGTCKCVPGYHHQKTKNTCSRRTVGINQKCNRNTDCNKSNSRCSRGTCKCVPGYHHQKTKNTCSRRTVGINQKCNRNTDCNKSNSRCSRGTCKCVPGYHHQKTKNTCSRSGIDEMCSRNSHCRVVKSECLEARCKCLPGFTYNRYTRTCRKGARRTKERGSSYQSGGYPGIGGIEQMCPRNGHCRVVNSVCLKGRCKCTPGYSYNPPAHSCVRTCRRYGSTASIYFEIGITGHNNKELKTRSPRECMYMCASEKSFLCRSFDYKPSDGCKLSSYGYLDVEEKFRETDATGWTFGTRNCAL